MKVYEIYWKDETDETLEDYDYNSGTTQVVAKTITKAIARFQKEYGLRRVIESVNIQGKEVLLDI